MADDDEDQSGNGDAEHSPAAEPLQDVQFDQADGGPLGHPQRQAAGNDQHGQGRDEWDHLAPDDGHAVDRADEQCQGEGAEHEHPGAVRHQQPSGDAGGGQHRPHRQVDASGSDHERHADGDDAGDAGLREHVEQVVAGQEDARPDDRPDDDQSNDHYRQHQLLDGHLAQAAPSVDRGCVGVDGHFLTLPLLCDEPGQPTAARPPRCWSRRRARRRCGPHASPARGGRNRAARPAHWKP